MLVPAELGVWEVWEVWEASSLPYLTCFSLDRAVALSSIYFVDFCRLRALGYLVISALKLLPQPQRDEARGLLIILKLSPISEL